MNPVWLLIGALTQAGTPQASISRVEQLPRLPSPYQLIDWRKRAVDLDDLVFKPGPKHPFLPLVWGVGKDRFGMPSYVGQETMRGQTGEAITQLGLLLGSTVVGRNRFEWVQRTPQFLSGSERLILNNVGAASGSSFWYELLPSLDFVQLASRYPSWTSGRSISTQIADEWVIRTSQLGGDFNHTSFDPKSRKGFQNKDWREPDASAAVAYLELFEGLRSKNRKYLDTARRALSSLESNKANPTYEVLTAYGVQAAAYLNAHTGDHWDTAKMLNWCFDPTSPNRTGWGMITGRWGDYDVGGLMGSTTDGGGYAFAMNTFLNLAALAPVARYEPKYSASLAKWVLNATNASRLFYGDSLLASHQSSADWTGDSKHALAYEGLRATWEGKSPFAAGDARRSGWAKTDWGVYGSGYVGLLGALVHPTNVPMILRIDLCATDFLAIKPKPTSLFWNPHPVSKTISFNLGTKPVRPFEVLSHRYLRTKPVSGVIKLTLAPNQAAQVRID